MTRPAKQRVQPMRGLAACTPRDFDGHTEFAAMTAEQRLRWLDEARDFIVHYCGAARAAQPAHAQQPKENS